MLKIQRLITAAAIVGLLSACGTVPNSSSSRHDIELDDPVLVRNSDGTATLSATIINHTDRSISLNDAGLGDPDSLTMTYLAVYGHDADLAPGSITHIGDTDDPIRIRLRESTNLATATPLWLSFANDDTSDLSTPLLTARLVERTSEHADVAGEGPNTDIQVNGGKIVKVPGQARAYVTGSITGSIDDVAYKIPTATYADGRPIEWRFQTATGGPYGIFVDKSKPTTLGSTAPFLQPETDIGGDADYFRAADLTLGEVVTVKIAFQSGDVIAKLEVVQGNADGMIRVE